MTVLLELVSKAALGELFKRLTEFAMKKVSQLPSFSSNEARDEAEQFVRLNLELPPGTSKEQKKVAIEEATMLVIPSFQEIMRFNPTTREIERRSGVRRFGNTLKKATKKAVAKKAAAKKVAARRPARKMGFR